MRLIASENDVYLSEEDFLKCGIDVNTARVGKARGSKNWQAIKSPDDNRCVLYKYSSLSEPNKKKVLDTFGDPYEYVAKQPIKQLIETDFKANSFFVNYRFDGNNTLPLEHIQSYTAAASWLNMLLKFNDDKKYIKKQLNLTISEFYDHAMQIIEAENIDLPTSYRRLREKMKVYQEKGYECLVSAKFGNSNSTKVSDELAESLLLEMLAHPNQWDDVYIAWQYNSWAEKNKRPTIHHATVGNYRRKNLSLIITQREGRESYYNNYSKVIKGRRPSTPLYLVESDDNHLDFYFTDWDDTSSHKHYNKFKAIVVTDSFNDYVLGYAFAQELTADVVRQAYLNAMYHIKELTGGWYLPHELKTDRWAIGQLENFYKSLGNYYKTPVNSKRRGYLEQYFGSVHWKRAQKAGTNNYTGNNITAATPGVNKEVLKLNRYDYPSIQEAPQHIDDFFFRLRTMPDPDSTGKSKQQQWIEAFNAAAVEKLKPITDTEFLLKLGILRSETNRITNRGLDITVGGMEFNYDIPDEYYFNYKGCEVNTIIDPYDMSRILVTDFNNIRFIATTPHYQARAMADYQPGERTLLNQQLLSKQMHVETVANEEARRKQVLKDSSVDITALLTSGFVLKKDRQDAELEFQVKQMEQLPAPPPKNRKPIDPLSKM